MDTNNVSTKKYIGPKIVPHFADPMQWDISKTYDALSIVVNDGKTYWAKYNVPSGIDINNTEYWYLSAYPDAQIETLIQEIEDCSAEIATYDSRIATLENNDTSLTTRINTLESTDISLETRINTLESTDISLENRINSLESTDISFGNRLTNLETYSIDYNNRITTLENEPILKLTEVVFIGDSFTSPVYLINGGESERDRWCYSVANFLVLNPHIYAERGAGYKRVGSSADGGLTFVGMLAQAYNDSTFNNNAVKYVFVYGGLNDMNHENMDTVVTTEYPTFINNCKTYFPNATCVVCGINAWPESFSSNAANTTYFRTQMFYEQLMKAQDAFINNNAMFISMSGALAFNSNNYYAANRHPNLRGNKQIATWIIGVLSGNPLMFSNSCHFYTKDDTSTPVGNLYVHFKPGEIECYGDNGTTGTERYMLDDFNIFKDQGFHPEGITTISGTTAANLLLGRFGVRDSDNYVRVFHHGYFRFTRLF